MVDSDIRLKKERIRVVGGDGTEAEGGRERGDLEVTAGKGKSASITLNADRANATLGGGAGKAPEGDLKLLDKGGTNRVQVTAETNSSGRTRGNVGDQTVWVDGGSGSIHLAGRGVEYGTIEPSIELDGSQGTVELAEPGSNSAGVTIDPASSGRIEMTDPSGNRSVRLSGNSDEPGVHSELLLSEFDSGGVDIYTTEPGKSVTSYPAGVAALHDELGNKGVELQGAQASVRVGYSYVDTDRSAGGGVDFSTSGRAGSIFIDDGNVGPLGVASAVFEVRASQGRLEITSVGTQGSQPLFSIDPSAKAIEIPGDWKITDGSKTVLD